MSQGGVVPDVVVVDHHDSYTWNLVHLIASVTGTLPAVVQHDETSAASVLAHDLVVLSPGPGTPADPVDFAVGTEVLRAATVPVLGVCLGLQGLVTAYGGQVARVRPAHGEVARISHDGLGVFTGLPQDFAAVRYHSLAAVTLPDVLEVSARAEDGTVMGVRHRSLPLEGVQFHPESILSEHGAALIANFVAGGLMTDPSAYFVEVANEHPRCFWLDGGGAREWSGRRSIIGWLDDDDVSLTYSAARREVWQHRGGESRVVGDDIFDVLERELASPDGGQWFGYFGYACRPDLPARADDSLPDAVWMRPGPGRVRAFEHEVLGESLMFSGVATPRNVRNPRFTGDSSTGAETAASGPTPEYAAAFARVQEELRAGNSYEVNLTHRVLAADPRGAGDPADVYLRLRALNPAPYAGFLQHEVPEVNGASAWLLSSSPERYAVVTAERTLETKPIKGTTPRGETPQEDERQRQDLATRAKYRAENLMIVDLLRNDLAQVCEVGTVEVPHLMEVESYANVHQLVSTVRGRLRDDVSSIGALRALFPPGSMTGAPKLRTMEIIEAVEATPRGAYAGAFGWISSDGRADLGVVIRSLMTARRDGHYVLGTGGGITVASDLDQEWEEAGLKAERLLRAVDGDAAVAGDVTPG